jgi:hypothetical protein
MGVTQSRSWRSVRQRSNHRRTKLIVKSQKTSSIHSYDLSTRLPFRRLSNKRDVLLVSEENVWFVRSYFHTMKAMKVIARRGGLWLCILQLATRPCTASIFPLLTESKSSSSSRPLIGQITALELVNTMNDLKLMTLVNGTIVNFTAIGLTGPSFSIRALVNGSDIQSVQFGLDGRPNHKVENIEPYFLCGNRGRDAFECRALVNGNHTVTATPYGSQHAQGAAGKSITVSFAIVGNVVVTATAPVPRPWAPSTVAIPSTPAAAPVARPVAPRPSSSPAAAPPPPFAAPMAAAPLPSELRGCYLRNLALGQETLLTGSDSYTMERSNTVGFSMRCDVVDSAKDEIKFIKFFYNGKEHDEFGLPRWLDGDSNEGAYIVPVPYLAWCGNKNVVVQGRSWTAVRFEKVYSLVTRCPQQVRRK